MSSNNTSNTSPSKGISAFSKIPRVIGRLATLASVLSAVIGVAIVIRGWTWAEALAVFPYLAFECGVVIFGLFQGSARAWASFSEWGGEIFLPILGTWLYPIVVSFYGAGTGLSTLLFLLIYLWLAWSILYLRKNFSVLPEARALAQKGPYRIVRHPMYLGYCALWIAWAAGFGFAVWPWVWSIVGILLYFYRARVEEKKLRAFVPGYTEYAQKVPGIIPFLKFFKMPYKDHIL